MVYFLYEYGSYGHLPVRQLKQTDMAIIENLFDSGRGMIGNLVFYKLNGRGVVRARPQRYRDKKSPKQLAQRQRLQVMNDFLRPFNKLVRVTFASEAVGRSALQAAQSHNMKHALTGEFPAIHVDYGRALLSRGPLPLPAGASAEAHPEGLLIRWENGSEAAGSAAYDTLVVMALSEKTGYCDYKFTEARRRDGQYVWKVALPVSQEVLPAVWIAFRKEEMTLMSDSMYVSGLS